MFKLSNQFKIISICL
ncbi:SVM family protein, partial [Candidatus Phytoplasma crotalariae]